MSSRASITRIFRVSQVSKHGASNYFSLWSFGRFRLDPLIRSWSVAHRTLSTTNARKLDLADVMVPPEAKGPAQIFRTHLAEGTLTKHLAVSCLQDAVCLNEPHSRAGEAAIKWLWDKHDSIKYPDDVDLINPTAILLVKEGKEGLLWDWMNQESQRPAPDITHPNDRKEKRRLLGSRYAWREAAFRGLVEAKAHLATDNSLDAALEAFFRGLQVPYYLLLNAAGNFCHRMLCTAEGHGLRRSYEDLRSGLLFANTRLKMWDAFYLYIGKRPKYYAAQHQATMKLYHPQQPDPWPLYRWWRDAKHDSNHPLHSVRARSSMLAAVETPRDLRITLKHFGHHKEAVWLEAFTLELFPRNKRYSGKSTRERLGVGLNPTHPRI